MKDYNVYEQRFLLHGGKDAKGNVVWLANLVRIGRVSVALGECPLDEARKAYKLRLPVVHELDHRGDERFYR